MKKETFYFDSAYCDVKIFAVRYIPDGEIKAILQISHGMVEFIERYEEFAEYLCNRGFLVTGNDQLGHGKSVKSKEDWGYFCENHGNDAILTNLHRLTVITKKKYPNIPYFLLGHSMGSFYARQYLYTYGKELNGAIIMGTGFQPLPMIYGGIIASKLFACIKGWKYRSNFVNNLAFGGYNRKFQPARTPYDWLSTDTSKVDEYIADERSHFIFTLNGYYNMLTGITRLHKKNLLNKMPKQLPVFFVSGSDDPVGEFSKGVHRAAKSFHNVGMTDVSLKLYPGGRHEILNEKNRQTVYRDLAEWMEHILNA